MACEAELRGGHTSHGGCQVQLARLLHELKI
jgi:hypothetical protein